MNIVYFSHSYRPQDTALVAHVGRLMQSEGLIPSLDPPSKDVNAAKLERQLRSTDGMVAVLSWREGGISQHILFEIGLCLRARKPLLVFVEDTLPSDVLPPRILQRRFSRQSLLGQIREHQHAIQIMKTYLGEKVPPRYQPSAERRSCLLVGISDLPEIAKEAVARTIDARGYSPIDLDAATPALLHDERASEALESADFAVCFVDAQLPTCHYLIGAIRFAFLPAIILTSNPSYDFQPRIPKEYQPRIVEPTDTKSLQGTLEQEVNIFNEAFVELDGQREVEAYADLLLQASSLASRGDTVSRGVFVQELVVGTKYSAGQVGAQGPGAHAHDISFDQIWNEVKGEIDLPLLATELSELRFKLKEEATEPDHDIVVGSLASAERSAKEGDGPEALEHLARLWNKYKWVREKAEAVGCGMVSGALMAASRYIV